MAHLLSMINSLCIKFKLLMKVNRSKKVSITSVKPRSTNFILVSVDSNKWTHAIVLLFLVVGCTPFFLFWGIDEHLILYYELVHEKESVFNQSNNQLSKQFIQSINLIPIRSIYVRKRSFGGR